MNAGCFGKEFKDILQSIQAIDVFGNVITLKNLPLWFLACKVYLPSTNK